MYKVVLFVCCFLACYHTTQAQYIWDWVPRDSVTVRFQRGEIAGYTPDTATLQVWQIGTTFKPFFTTDTLGALAIMTDTINNYPVNANNTFTLKFQLQYNMIVDFWHRYDIDSTHDGGYVEFSLDTGHSWQNIKGLCNRDSGGMALNSVLTSNFYTFNDTLPTGIPCFKGNSGGTIFSRLQFFEGLPSKSTGTSDCRFYVGDTVYLRFHFVSDSIPDSLAGWMIDSIKIEADNYGAGFVNDHPYASKTLLVHPNPTTTGLFTFPEFYKNEMYRMQIFDAMGRELVNTDYTTQLDLRNYPAGVFFYVVSDGFMRYSGVLVYEQ